MKIMEIVSDCKCTSLSRHPLFKNLRWSCRHLVESSWKSWKSLEPHKLATSHGVRQLSPASSAMKMSGNQLRGTDLLTQSGDMTCHMSPPPLSSSYLYYMHSVLCRNVSDPVICVTGQHYQWRVPFNYPFKILCIPAVLVKDLSLFHILLFEPNCCIAEREWLIYFILSF